MRGWAPSASPRLLSPVTRGMVAVAVVDAVFDAAVASHAEFVGPLTSPLPPPKLGPTAGGDSPGFEAGLRPSVDDVSRAAGASSCVWIGTNDKAQSQGRCLG